MSEREEAGGQITREVSPTAALARAGAAPGPPAVAVYLVGHPAMHGALRAVLRVLGDAAAAFTVETFPWEGLRYGEVEAIRARLAETYKPATARHHLIAVRGVLKAAWKLGRLTWDEYQRAVAVDVIRGDSAPAGRMLTDVEIHRLLVRGDHLGATPAARRDAAMAALALFAGLRRIEISRLNCEDVEAGKVTVAKGKGSKRREVFIPPAAQEALAAWLAVRGGRPGPLFWRGRRNGAVAEGRLSISGVGRGLLDAAKRAGIENVTPHDFRRTFASTLLAEGVDLVEVSKRMGHDDPKTTKKYDRRGDAAGKDAAERLGKRWAKKEGA